MALTSPCRSNCPGHIRGTCIAVDPCSPFFTYSSFLFLLQCSFAHRHSRRIHSFRLSICPLRELSRVLYNMEMNRYVCLVVSPSADSLLSICLVFLSHRIIERSAILGVSFSSYLDIWHPNDILRRSQHAHRVPQRSENSINRMVARHPTAPSLILMPITLWLPLQAAAAKQRSGWLSFRCA